MSNTPSPHDPATDLGFAGARRASARGALEHRPVEPENPYWIDKGVAYADPDGWRVVLCGTPGI